MVQFGDAAAVPLEDELLLPLDVRQPMGPRREGLTIDVGVADRFQLDGAGVRLDAGDLADVQLVGAKADFLFTDLSGVDVELLAPAWYGAVNAADVVVEDELLALDVAGDLAVVIDANIDGTFSAWPQCG